MASSERESFAQNTARVAEFEQRKVRIRQLNDGFRTHLVGGYVTITRGVRELGEATVRGVLNAVASFEAFASSNDPYQEHDFGAVTVEGKRVFWKIDYYDQQLELGSPDPADPAVTTRVLTIMLAQEY